MLRTQLTTGAGAAADHDHAHRNSVSRCIVHGHLLRQVMFPIKPRNGSLIAGQMAQYLAGSSLIGQTHLIDPRYFWSRPSATITVSGDNAAASSNGIESSGPTNPASA